MKNTSENIRDCVDMILAHEFSVLHDVPVFCHGLQAGRLISLMLFCDETEDRKLVEEAMKEIDKRFKELKKELRQ